MLTSIQFFMNNGKQMNYGKPKMSPPRGITRVQPPVHSPSKGRHHKKRNMGMKLSQWVFPPVGRTQVTSQHHCGHDAFVPPHIPCLTFSFSPFSQTIFKCYIGRQSALANTMESACLQWQILWSFPEIAVLKWQSLLWCLSVESICCHQKNALCRDNWRWGFRECQQHIYKPSITWTVVRLCN